jgi:BON domain
MNPIVTLLHAIEYLQERDAQVDDRDAIDYLGSAYADLLRDHERERPRILPHKIRISQGEEFFWRTATVFAVAAVLFLLLAASVHRLSPFPGGLAPSSGVAQQQTPFHGTTATESVATKPVEPLVLSDQPPARVENSGSSDRRGVKSNSLHSTYGSEAHLVAEENARVASEIENRIRADRRLQMTQVQVRASHGIVTLLGDVGSDAERVAAAQDAAKVGGIEAFVNNLRVITHP